MSKKDARVGCVGLGSMGGHMLGLFAERGDRVTGYEVSKEAAEIARKQLAEDDRVDESTVELHDDMVEFASSFQPNERRVIVLSLPHGQTGDLVIDELLPLLDQGDILIDGANEHWQSTERRQARCLAKGVHHLALGVSGGYQAARNGPSFSPSGTKEAYEIAAPYLTKWAAKDDKGKPQCRYIGPGGSGHFVKAIHNGIEQGILGIICEAYQLLRSTLAFSNDQIADIFDSWSESGELKTTFLIDIGAQLLRFKEGAGKKDPKGIVDDMDDKVVQDVDNTEGTGVWTAEALAARHVAGPTIFAAHSLRLLSAEEDQRIAISKLLEVPKPSRAPTSLDSHQFVDDLRLAVYAGVLASFAQGLNLIFLASAEERWDISLRDCLGIWRAGCIIQALAVTDLLDGAYERQAQLPNPLLDEQVAKEVSKTYAPLKRACQLAIEVDAVVPALTASLEYLKSIGGRHLPTAFQEAEMDSFGSHSFDWRDENQHEARKGKHHVEFRPA